MPQFGPIHRRDLLAYLRQLGFDGPYPGGNHQYMVRGTRKLYVPNPHRGMISQGLLGRILVQSGIRREEWEAL